MDTLLITVGPHGHLTDDRGTTWTPLVILTDMQIGVKRLTPSRRWRMKGVGGGGMNRRN